MPVQKTAQLTMWKKKPKANWKDKEGVGVGGSNEREKQGKVWVDRPWKCMAALARFHEDHDTLASNLIQWVPGDTEKAGLPKAASCAALCMHVRGNHVHVTMPVTLTFLQASPWPWVRRSPHNWTSSPGHVWHLGADVTPCNFSSVLTSSSPCLLKFLIPMGIWICPAILCTAQHIKVWFRWAQNMLWPWKGIEENIYCALVKKILIHARFRGEINLFTDSIPLFYWWCVF